MMKVAFVTHRVSKAGGGVSAVVEALSVATERLGCRTRVFGLRDNDWDTDKKTWSGAEVAAFDTIGPRGAGIAPNMFREVQNFGPDIAHSHGIWMHTSTIQTRLKQLGTPYVVSPHGMLDPAALEISKWKKRLAKLAFEGKHLSNASCLHALNEAEAEGFRRFGLRNPIAVIPNGVETPSENSSLPSPPWEEDFAPGSKILLFLGRLHPKKNPEGLIRAFAKLKNASEATEWRLVFAGWGDNGYDQVLIELTDNLNLSDEVAFVGPIYGSQKRAAFVNSKVFILPSFSEGLPMAALEAFSHGVPIAVTRHCNMSEAITVGAAFPISTQVHELTQELSKILKEQDSRFEKMGEAGRSLVQNKYAWPSVAESFRHVYSWLCGKKDVVPSCVHLG